MNSPPSVPWRTPSLSVHDCRGMAVRQVAYLRSAVDGPVQTLISRQRHDAGGHLIEQYDARLPAPVIRSVYGLDGQPLRVDSVDAGHLLNLPGVAGEEVQRWDALGNHWHTRHDEQLRPVAVAENGAADVDTFIYADASAAAGHNRRGQLIELNDPAGQLRLVSFALTPPGQAVRDSRTLDAGPAFVSQRRFSPLGALLEQTDAAGHRQQSTYDVAGQLMQVQLQLSGQTTWQTVQQQAHYNAAGQIVKQHSGNAVISRWGYDAADGRLLQQCAQKHGEAPLQDLQYVYDRVGNVTAIVDHTVIPRFFANQRIDGQRTFTYDSLDRLLSASGYADAPPADNPGRPQPSDPNDRRNYLERYEYDAGHNLIKTTHVRDGASHTREMFIDPASNRGVRWRSGDPAPDFERLFDSAGNLLAVQPGQPLHWDSRGQLQAVTLIDRGGRGDDQESYRYSQGARVCKRHESHTTRTTHVHQVRYLPGLEIHSKDNGEELHVISLGISRGGARCLHWAQDPAAIGTDHLRYTLDDHLGSAVQELDAHAQLISHEGYLPFGATAFLTARSAVEVSYRTVRYSGKDLDISGFYYYGARYYAPWLQRWISADPSGDVDGLNLYGFVANNPLRFIDRDGRGLGEFIDGFVETPGQRDTRKAESAQTQAQFQANMALSRAVDRHARILDLTTRRAQEAQTQLLNHQSAPAHAKSAALRTAAHVGGQVVSYGAGIGIGAAGAALGSVAGPVGTALGVFLGIAGKKAVSLGVDFAMERLSLSASVKFKSGKLDPNRIVAKGEYKTMNYGSYALNKFRGIVHGLVAMNQKGLLKAGKEGVTVGASVGMKAANTPFSSEIGAVLSTVTGTFEILHEVAGAGQTLSQEKVRRADSYIDALVDVLNASLGEIQGKFEQAGRDSIHTYQPLKKIFGADASGSLASLTQATANTIRQLRRTQNLLRGA
jgi:insecticidal toxin complex protein TccC